MREDIDIRLLDYYVFYHCDVDRSQSLVATENETGHESENQDEREDNKNLDMN